MAANVNNYVKAGNAAVRKAVLARKALAENKPRYDEMAMEAVNQRAKDNANIAENNSKTARMKMDAEAGIKKTNLAVDAEKYKQGQERKARMTGLLAGGAAILGYAGMQGKKEDENTEMLDLIRAQTQWYKTKSAQEAAKGNEPLPRPELPVFETPDGVAPSSSSTPSDSTGGSSSTQTTASGSVDPAKIYNYLTTEKGLSRNKALGLMANIERESSFRPSVASGDDGGAGGLFQWKGGRQTETVRRLVQAGDWKGQIDYALSEPGEPYSSTFQNTTFNSPQAAADGWMTHWERPLDKAAGSKKHTTFLSRYNF